MANHYRKSGLEALLVRQADGELINPETKQWKTKNTKNGWDVSQPSQVVPLPLHSDSVMIICLRLLFCLMFNHSVTKLTHPNIIQVIYSYLSYSFYSKLYNQFYLWKNKLHVTMFKGNSFSLLVIWEFIRFSLRCRW